MLGRKSELSIENKLLLYKTILEPIWIYGITLWRTASNSKIEKLQRYQDKVIRAIVSSPWYDKVLHADLKVPTMREEITKFRVEYRDKITTHPNELASTLIEEEPRKLKKIQTNIFKNQILLSIISQICKHMMGEYSLECYSSRHVLNIV